MIRPAPCGPVCRGRAFACNIPDVRCTSGGKARRSGRDDHRALHPVWYAAGADHTHKGECIYMSVTIKIDHAHKCYGSNVIIEDLSVNIREGEFFTLLGPSGCGKTTLLRMIAGFNSIEGGDFYFNDKRINDMDPSKRRIGMVFQNYAIFPHLTVEKNVMFGLKNLPNKMTKAEMKEQTDKFMKLMHIEEYAQRIWRLKKIK